MQNVSLQGSIFNAGNLKVLTGPPITVILHLKLTFLKFINRLIRQSLEN